jgi:hypothetical protein
MSQKMIYLKKIAIIKIKKINKLIIKVNIQL